MPEQAAASGPGRTIGWTQVYEHWDALEADLLERFGIDVWDDRVLDRPWPWLSAKIVGVLTTPLAHSLDVTEKGFVSRAYPTTRLQQALSG